MDILDKINLTDVDSCKYYEANGKYYLVSHNTDFFILMRLGDLSIMITLLYNIKRKLIGLYPDKFNLDNLFFIYSNDQSKNLVGINDLLLYAPRVFDQPAVNDLTKDFINKYNVNQIWPRFHNLKVNSLYRRWNLTLSETMFPNVPLIPQRVIEYPTLNKNRVLILPTTGKLYHVERNLSNRMIVNIINSLPTKYDNVYIINKDVYLRDLREIEAKTNRHITILGNDWKWAEIVDIATQLCDVYIGGDCGFTHLLANMYNSPNTFINFYRTRRSKDPAWCHNLKRFVNNKPEHQKVLIGIDNLLKIDLRLLSIYRRNIIFQDNWCGKYLKPYSYYYGQHI